MKIDDQAKRNIQQLHCDREDACGFSTPKKQRKRRILFCAHGPLRIEDERWH
jgi:hypothetical protein